MNKATQLEFLLFRCVHFGVEAGGGEWCSTADEACGGAILQATPAEQVPNIHLSSNIYIENSTTYIIV